MYDYIIKGMAKEVIKALKLKSKEDKALVNDVLSKYCKTYVIEERL